jgi:endonuclease I
MRIFSLIVFSILSITLIAQPPGYYNGTEGKTGSELKDALNDIISGHMEWAYFYADHVFLSSDADPNTPGNVITVYKGSSVDGGNYGTGGDFLNREHVWAKSHGQFGTDLPTGGDLHNLKPADGSVNVDRSNKDFDNCQTTGTQHPEATGCYYTSDAWEPRDEVKGDIARIIFYMATRYEGENGEVDLEVNDQVNNSPNPYHGRLSALLQWHEQDPPDEFERNRNNVIYSYQQNRNPFIDNPEWVGMIWGSDPANSISIGDMSQSKEIVFTGETVIVAARINGTGTVSATLNWGTDLTNMPNTITMDNTADIFHAVIPSQATETDVYYSITATDDNGSYSSVPYMYHVEAIFNGTIQAISDVQGEQASTPFLDQEVTVSGIVTANFGEGFFLQDGPGQWDGIYVYDVKNPQIGDSIIITGTVTEYYDLTEIVNITEYYLISRNNELPEPVVITASEAGEAYEGVLVKVIDATCTNDDSGFGMWELTDETGSILVHNNQVYEFSPYQNEVYTVTGPLKYDFSEWKIELRGPDDVGGAIDSVLPYIQEVQVLSTTSLYLIFSEYLNMTSAQVTSNYSVNNGVTVSAATLNIFAPNMVSLTTSEMSDGAYELSVSGVKDEAGNIMDPDVISFNVGNGIVTNSSFEFLVFPNPNNGSFSVSNASSIEEMNILDVSGKIIQTHSGSLTENLDVNGLHNGVYFIQIIDNKNQKTLKKIIVQ